MNNSTEINEQNQSEILIDLLNEEIANVCVAAHFDYPEIHDLLADIQTRFAAVVEEQKAEWFESYPDDYSNFNSMRMGETCHVNHG